MGGFEILEHTADVGIRAIGARPSEVLEQAARALAEVMGVWRPEANGSRLGVQATSHDLGGLLVGWLEEVLYELETRAGGLCAVEASVAGPAGGSGQEGWTARGALLLTELGDEDIDGTPVKAVTLHRLRFEQVLEGWVAECYLDV